MDKILFLIRQPKLPCIEDAWNFPISQEMASRQNAAAQGQMVSIKFKFMRTCLYVLKLGSVELIYSRDSFQ